MHAMATTAYWAWRDIVRLHAQRGSTHRVAAIHVLTISSSELSLIQGAHLMSLSTTNGSAIAVLASLVDILVHDLDAFVVVADGPEGWDSISRSVDLARDREAIVTGPGVIAARGEHLLHVFEKVVPRLVRLLLFCAARPADEAVRFREEGLRGMPRLEIADIIAQASQSEVIQRWEPQRASASRVVARRRQPDRAART